MPASSRWGIIGLKAGERHARKKGDAVDAYAARVLARTASHFISATKHYPIYVVRHGGEDIALCRASVGAAPAAQLLDWLIGHARRALRDEGTSYHYAPPTRYVDVSEHARRTIRETMRAHGLPYQEVLTWSTDGFYRETRVKVEARRREGCAVVEMECAALAACAGFR